MTYVLMVVRRWTTDLVSFNPFARKREFNLDRQNALPIEALYGNVNGLRDGRITLGLAFIDRLR